MIRLLAVSTKAAYYLHFSQVYYILILKDLIHRLNRVNNSPIHLLTQQISGLGVSGRRSTFPFHTETHTDIQMILGLDCSAGLIRPRQLAACKLDPQERSLGREIKSLSRGVPEGELVILSPDTALVKTALPWPLLAMGM